MSVEENKALVRQIYAAFNARNPDALNDLLAANFVDHYPGPGQAPGREGIKQVWTSIWAKFPEIHIMEEGMLAEEDRVASWGMFRASDMMLGRMMEIFRVADGRATDLWNIIEFSG